MSSAIEIHSKTTNWCFISSSDVHLNGRGQMIAGFVVSCHCVILHTKQDLLFSIEQEAIIIEPMPVPYAIHDRIQYSLILRL